MFQSLRFALTLAFRDGLRDGRILILSLISMAFAMGAHVAVISFNAAVRESVDSQAKGLLGADYAVSSRRTLSGELVSKLRNLPFERAEVLSFASMMQIEGALAGRLMRVLAVEGEYPLYGSLVTTPAVGIDVLANEPVAILDQNVMFQYGLEPGMNIKLGKQSFKLVAALESLPGDASAFALVAPKILISRKYVESTGLLKQGSVVFFQFFYKDKNPLLIKKLLAELSADKEFKYLRVESVEDRKERVGRSLSNLEQFLLSVSLLALLVAAVGVGSAVYYYGKKKEGMLAILKCLGATSEAASLVFSIQVFGLLFLGALLGYSGAIGFYKILISRLEGILPVALSGEFPLGEAVLALFWGVLVGLACALPSLSKLSHISALSVLRQARGLEEKTRSLFVASSLLLALLLISFCYYYAETGEHALKLFFGFIGAFLLIFLLGTFLRTLVTLIYPLIQSFSFKHGMRSLSRTKSFSLVLLPSIAIIATTASFLVVSYTSLLSEILAAKEENRANMILFDIQEDQLQSVSEKIESTKGKVISVAPMISMRIQSIKGITAESFLDNKHTDIPRWALEKEYRSTYRGEMTEAEKLLEGAWHGSKAFSLNEKIPVSIERRQADRLGLKLNDNIVFDVQGILVKAYIGSIRSVQWQRIEPNFFLVFPNGVLEEAPKTYIVSAYGTPGKESSELQRAVVEHAGNVSIIDLQLVITTINQLLTAISGALGVVFVIFLITALLVLFATLLLGAHQKRTEYLLLKMLGATKEQLFKVTCSEFLTLGSVGIFGGAFLGALIAWIVLVYYYQTPFVVPWVLILATASIGAIVLTLILSLIHI